MYVIQIVKAHSPLYPMEEAVLLMHEIGMDLIPTRKTFL
jgi:hypothetical protein